MSKSKVPANSGYLFVFIYEFQFNGVLWNGSSSYNKNTVIHDIEAKNLIENNSSVSYGWLILCPTL